MNAPWTLAVYVTFVLGGLSVYLMLPRGRHSYRAAGVVFGVSALALAMLVCANQFLGTEGANAVFYVSAIVAVVAAVKVITHEQAVYSALYFVLVILAVTPMLIIQSAEFLAIALVIVYAGAILVTYVFVIMLAQQTGAPSYDRRCREPFVAALAGFATMGAIAGQFAVLPERWAIQGTLTADAAAAPTPASLAPAAAATAASPGDGGDTVARYGNTERVGEVMLTQYVVAFEMAGVLLLVAMIGAIAVTRKHVPSEGAVPTGPPPGQIGREVAPF